MARIPRIRPAPSPAARRLAGQDVGAVPHVAVPVDDPEGDVEAVEPVEDHADTVGPDAVPAERPGSARSFRRRPRQAVGAVAAGATCPAKGPTGKWQATWCPGETSRRGGSSAAQRDCA